MKRLLGAVILVLVGGCSSTEEGNAANDVTAGGGAAGNVNVVTDASSGGSTSEAAPPADHSVATVVDTGNPSDSKPSMSDAPKIVDAGPVDAPMTCVKYCSCMAMNCAEKVFATGCLVECARQSNWDLPCRQNMCNLAPVQTMNDHCTHAFGVGQCTDN